ncbi:hypothetical protein BJ508DRAFT_308465 [Ascobolus immersus RN42]|uniref:Uncharacterized protein n=1 Tax=Ascobolus immersus RN42 TaxID=1160509 RepID=A0A3N4ICD3_ASCIM|nr:hypothetical protein BJ508DRAFT_308465 [Ascobolus immersus RN42]
MHALSSYYSHPRISFQTQEDEYQQQLEHRANMARHHRHSPIHQNIYTHHLSKTIFHPHQPRAPPPDPENLAHLQATLRPVQRTLPTRPMENPKFWTHPSLQIENVDPDADGHIIMGPFRSYRAKFILLPRIDCEDVEGRRKRNLGYAFIFFKNEEGRDNAVKAWEERLQVARVDLVPVEVDEVDEEVEEGEVVEDEFGLDVPGVVRAEYWEGKEKEKEDPFWDLGWWEARVERVLIED